MKRQMPTYTFFRYGSGPDSPSFDVAIFDDKAQAMGHATDLLLKNSQYYAVEVLEGDEQIILVERGDVLGFEPVQPTLMKHKSPPAGRPAGS